MKHVVVEARDHGNWLNPHAYLELLPTLARDLPIGAHAFAADPEHYNFVGQRCIKDLKPDRVSHGETDGERWLQLNFQHNCWKHQENLTIHYSGVSNIFPASSCGPPPGTNATR